MHQAAAVRVIERVGQLDGDAQHLGDRQRAAQQPLFERLALEILHHEEPDRLARPGRCRFADVVQLTDVRMVERGDGPRFALEPLTPIGIGRKGFGQHLERHHAIEARVAGLVDLAHPACAEARNDLVGSEPHAVGESHDLICLKKNRTRATRKPHNGC